MRFREGREDPEKEVLNTPTKNRPFWLEAGALRRLKNLLRFFVLLKRSHVCTLWVLSQSFLLPLQFVQRPLSPLTFHAIRGARRSRLGL